MNLTGYLAAKGPVKSLMQAEAEIFGVPYPLMNGWPAIHGNMDITPKMVEQLRARVGGRTSVAGIKAQRGIDALDGIYGSEMAKVVAPKRPVVAPAPRPTSAASFHGFMLRAGRRAAPVVAGLLPLE